ncbi:unnamed protein product [Spirodela intermedia]|uniref:Uncharacterized protein n=1 Tax=Spirodela intermedia TaxID=51605 RepID=A0A7I8IEI2_SPIIN|nr:unnamed protein product [Spirodela intermedia]CAA6656196.1 unnamed protein product [Spirodela intermedia]
MDERRVVAEPDLPWSYAPLPDGEEEHLAVSPSRPRPLIFVLRALSVAFAGVFLLAAALGLTAGGWRESGPQRPPELRLPAVSRGPALGVSEKASGVLLGAAAPRYTWTNAMLLWQRTAFHFQPEKNWMNGSSLLPLPSYPTLFYKGWYHLFYQYNPESAVWGNITWGHAVSRDLIHWFYLPSPWFPTAGTTPTASGPALPHSSPTAALPCSTPAPPTPPCRYKTSPFRPTPPTPPPRLGQVRRRQPGARPAGGHLHGRAEDRIALVYSTRDFISYDLLDGVLHAVPGTGMWECVDFYPVAAEGVNGLDTSANGPGVKHVLKASLDDDKHDYYAIGTYDLAANRWTPDDPEADVGIGLRVDYGKYYASKTFYDQKKQRRLLWGWIGETDSESTDLQKGWASVQTIPRTVLLDQRTGTNLLQWPVEEVESLRNGYSEFDGVEIAAGSVVPLDVGSATQLDIVAEFEVGKEALEGTVEADVGYNCSTSGGAAARGALGPFGLLVLAVDGLSEQTAVYFYIARKTDGELGTFICQDELRSSKADDLVKRVYGSAVPVLDGEKFAVRILVDHSIVETFAQGGRTCITSRVYPTEAIYGAARVFLFNNATAGPVTAATVKIWQLSSALIRPYTPSDGH